MLAMEVDDSSFVRTRAQPTVSLSTRETDTLTKIQHASIPSPVRNLAERWILSGVSGTLFVITLAIVSLVILLTTESVSSNNAVSELQNDIAGLNETKDDMEREVAEMRAREKNPVLTEAQVARIEMAAMQMESMEVVTESTGSPLPDAKIMFSISMFATEKDTYSYTATSQHAGNLTLERKGKNSPTLIHIKSPYANNFTEFEIFREGNEATYLVVPVTEECPDACQTCQRKKGASDFECMLSIPLSMDDEKRTCGGSRSNNNGRCLKSFDYKQKTYNGCTLEGTRGKKSEWCYTDSGFDSWGYCRCANTSEIVDIATKVLPKNFYCRDFKPGQEGSGVGIATCMRVLHTIKKDVTNAKPNAMSINAVGEKLDNPLFFSTSPYDTQRASHEATYWTDDCRRNTGEAPKKLCVVPFAADDFQYGSLNTQWHLRVGNNLQPHDFVQAQPLVILGILADLDRRRYNVNLLHMSAENIEDVKPTDLTARCGKPNWTYSDEDLEADDILHALLKPAHRPCIHTLTRSGCKCNGAEEQEDGSKLAWCYVEDCDHCGEGNEGSCTKPPFFLMRPYAYCYGDGLYDNRPWDGICPQKHKCTGKPYSGTKDVHMVDLKSTLGHAIRGKTAEIPHFSQSAWWEPESATQSVPVDYLFCLPLGEFSHLLVSGLYVSADKTADLRTSIPINTRLLGFSIDVFVSSAIQDFHIKLDTRILCSLDASYIDAEQWLDLIQPFASRNEFPLMWPVYQLQRNKKKML